MLTRQEGARIHSLQSFAIVLTPSVLPLRTIWFGELILPMWTSSRPWIISSRQIEGRVHGRHDAGVHVHGSGLVHAEGLLFTIRNPFLRGIDTGQAQGGQFAKLWPAMATGWIPRVVRYRAMAYSMANMAGCCHRSSKVLLPIVEQQVKEVEVRLQLRPIHPLLMTGKDS